LAKYGSDPSRGQSILAGAQVPGWPVARDQGEDGSSRTQLAPSIIYLACPYTDSDRLLRLWRFEMATAAAATLIKRGYIVFSPITMTHPIDVVLAGSDNTLGSDYWVKFDEAFMSMCSEMVILNIDGWDRSSGIKREIEFFRNAGKPVSFMAPSEVEFIPEMRNSLL
jgi:hypothetical protein